MGEAAMELSEVLREADMEWTEVLLQYLNEDDAMERAKLRERFREVRMGESPAAKAALAAKARAKTKELDMAMMKRNAVDLCHVGYRKSSWTISPGMKPFVLFRDDDYDTIDLEKTWERMEMAARTIAAIENPQDILVASDVYLGDEEAVPLFVEHTGTRAFIDGASYDFTATATRLLILNYPATDSHRDLMEKAYRANIPIIAFCDVDCPMDYVDAETLIPAHCDDDAVLYLFKLLSRMVLQMRGLLPQGHYCDAIFYPHSEESNEEEEEEDC